MKVLLTGANGQLGTAFQGLLPGNSLVPLTRSDLDIANRTAVADAVAEHKPDCIINCAAYNQVDRAEKEAEAAFQTNALGALHLAQAANHADTVLVHFSTDYVFDGKKQSPCRESDPPQPLGIYGLSKLTGEWLVRSTARKHFVIRTCGLYGHSRSVKAGNFAERMLEAAAAGKPLRVVSDQIVTPTSAHELAEKVLPLLETDAFGLYHMTNEGQCSWFAFAQEIFRQRGLSPPLEPVTSEQYNAPAARPLYSVLDNHAYRELGLNGFRPWQEALQDYLAGGAR